ncbi:hypothetical protein BC629DRAFT_963720 [Irpex lacteus]|nr:hypothetical protein BC629DRAFT_963720 [Irpex lacteus]
MEIAPASGVAANVTSSFGLLLIGTTLAFVLSGVSCMQLFMYYSGYPEDSYFMKITIFVIWAFATTKPMMHMSALWNVIIVGWGSPASFNDPLTGLLHGGWMAAVTITVVQCFFMWRIYALGGGRPWTIVVIVLIGMLSLTQFGETLTCRDHSMWDVSYQVW